MFNSMLFYTLFWHNSQRAAYKETIKSSSDTEPLTHAGQELRTQTCSSVLSPWSRICSRCCSSHNPNLWNAAPKALPTATWAQQALVPQCTEGWKRRLQEHHYTPAQRFSVLPQITVSLGKHRHFWENFPSYGYTRIHGGSQSPPASPSLLKYSTSKLPLNSATIIPVKAISISKLMLLTPQIIKNIIHKANQVLWIKTATRKKCYGVITGNILL